MEEKNIKKRKKKRVLHYYANDNNFSKTNIEIPEEYKNKIICGDSLEVLKQLPDNCIDLVFTSPPYNFSREYSEYEDCIPTQGYFDWLFSILKECIRVTKWGGRIAVNVKPLMSDFVQTHHMVSAFMVEQKMIHRNEIMWNTNNRNVHYSCWGSYIQPSSPYIKSTFEFIEIYSKGDIKHQKEDGRTADMQKLEFSEWVKNNIWSIAPERRGKEFNHPAMFPETLADRILRLFSFRGDIILDPFNGAGTTTKVAKETGRNYLGIDIDSNYCKTAQERVDKTITKEFKLILNEVTEEVDI